MAADAEDEETGDAVWWSDKYQATKWCRQMSVVDHRFTTVSLCSRM